MLATLALALGAAIVWILQRTRGWRPGAARVERPERPAAWPMAALGAAAAAKTHETVQHEALGFELMRVEYLKEYNSEVSRGAMVGLLQHPVEQPCPRARALLFRSSF